MQASRASDRPVRGRSGAALAVAADPAARVAVFRGMGGKASIRAPISRASPTSRAGRRRRLWARDRRLHARARRHSRHDHRCRRWLGCRRRVKHRGYLRLPYRHARCALWLAHRPHVGQPPVCAQPCAHCGAIGVVLARRMVLLHAIVAAPDLPRADSCFKSSSAGRLLKRSRRYAVALRKMRC